MVSVQLDTSQAARLIVEARIHAENAARQSAESHSTAGAEYYAKAAREWRAIENAVASAVAPTIFAIAEQKETA